MYSLYKGGPGVLPLNILKNLECRSLLGLFFIFLFFINQFSLFFFLLFFKIFRLFFIF